MVLQEIREKLFWMINKIKGGNIKKHYLDLYTTQ